MISEESIPDMDVTPLLHWKNWSNSVLIFREIISKQVMQTLTWVNDYNSIYKTKRIIKIIFDIIYKEFQNNWILYKNLF